MDIRRINEVDDVTGEFINEEFSQYGIQNQEAAEKFREELLAEFPGKDIWIDPLSLSVSCHIGPGALACTVTKKLIDIN